MQSNIRPRQLSSNSRAMERWQAAVQWPGEKEWEFQIDDGLDIDLEGLTSTEYVWALSE